MAKLTRFELDAVIDNTIQQIDEVNKNNQEMIKYRQDIELMNRVTNEIKIKCNNFVGDLKKEYEELYPNLKFSTDSYYNRIGVLSIKEPKSKVDRKQIEQDLIISNISGKIEETITKIVNKYTQK